MRELLRRRGIGARAYRHPLCYCADKDSITNTSEAQRFGSLTSLRFLKKRNPAISDQTLQLSEFYFLKSPCFVPPRVKAPSVSDCFAASPDFQSLLFFISPDWCKYKTLCWVKIISDSIPSELLNVYFFFLLINLEFIALVDIFLLRLSCSSRCLLFCCVSLTGNAKEDKKV